MTLFAWVFGGCYLAVAAVTYWWLAPRSRTWVADHANALALGLLWPIALMMLLALAAIELVNAVHDPKGRR